MRIGVFRAGLRALKETFGSAKITKPLDSNRYLHYFNFLTGKGRIKDKSAWYFKGCAAQPTDREADLIIDAFVDSFP